MAPKLNGSEVKKIAKIWAFLENNFRKLFGPSKNKFLLWYICKLSHYAVDFYAPGKISASFPKGELFVVERKHTITLCPSFSNSFVAFSWARAVLPRPSKASNVGWIEKKIPHHFRSRIFFFLFPSQKEEEDWKMGDLERCSGGGWRILTRRIFTKILIVFLRYDLWSSRINKA